MAKLMGRDLDQQFREIRHQVYRQGVGLLFAGNAAVAAAVVQWLLRTDSELPLLRFLALASAIAHGVGAILALRFPETWLAQFWKDQAAGEVEDPRIAAPMRNLQWSGRCFVIGVVLLAGGLLIREIYRICGS